MMRACLLLLALLPGVLSAASLELRLSDAKEGGALEDVVISLHPREGTAPMPDELPMLVVDQVDKTFIPHVLPVMVGTTVNFPNKDQIRHHVYSIDEAKPFDLPLYKGTPAKPVLFDNVGVVSLGCNIHDHMSGYIYVLDTPWFARSGADGVARIDNVPEGDYQLRVWHPRIKRADSYRRNLHLGAAEEAGMAMEIKLRRLLKRKARVRSRDGGY